MAMENCHVQRVKRLQMGLGILYHGVSYYSYCIEKMTEETEVLFFHTSGVPFGPIPIRPPYPQHEESRHQAVLRQLIRIEGVIGKAKKSAAELLARHAMEMMYPLVN